jgi:hypothetical protein
LWAAIGFADVGTNLQPFKIVNGLAAVIAHISHAFFDDRHCIVGDGNDGFELVGGFGQRLLDRRRVALVGASHRDSDDRARLERECCWILATIGSILHLDINRVDREESRRSSYWRCSPCGEVWNPARRTNEPAQRWRR